MSSVYYARPASAGYGYRYATAIGSTTEAIETKHWDVPPATMLSDTQNYGALVLKDPWELLELKIAAGAYENQWYIDWSIGLFWNLKFDHGVHDETNGLVIPIVIPHNSRFVKLEIMLDSDLAFDGGDLLKLYSDLRYYDKSTKNVVTHEQKNFGNSYGAPFDGTESSVVLFDAISGGDTAITVDADDKSFYCVLKLVDSADPGVTPTVVVKSATVTTYIREASHVY